MFRDHHYLSGDLNQSARCYLGIWNDIIVGFNAVITNPSGTLKHAWREHRTVILPDFQGLGLGTRFSDAIGEIMLAEGKRYFSKTAHPRLGEYREVSPKWRPTSHNKKARMDYLNMSKNFGAFWYNNNGNGKYSDALREKHQNRVCFAHEYIGEKK